MKTAALKMKNYTMNVDIVNNNNLNERLLHFLLVAFGILALCYVVILGSVVINVVERKTIEAEARNLANEVGDLELQYLALSGKVDLNLARSLGFSEVRKEFATRKSLGSLNIANNEL